MVHSDQLCSSIPGLFGRDILGLPDHKRGDLKAESSRRGLDFAPVTDRLDCRH